MEAVCLQCLHHPREIVFHFFRQDMTAGTNRTFDPVKSQAGDGFRHFKIAQVLKRFRKGAVFKATFCSGLKGLPEKGSQPETGGGKLQKMAPPFRDRRKMTHNRIVSALAAVGKS